MLKLAGNATTELQYSDVVHLEKPIHISHAKTILCALPMQRQILGHLFNREMLVREYHTVDVIIDHRAWLFKLTIHMYIDRL